MVPARLISVMLTAWILISCHQPPSVNEPEKILKIGYMICNSEEETLYRFRPLTAYLSEKLGVKMEAVAIDTTRFTREMEDLDFTHTNSLLYIILSRYHGVSVLAADIQGTFGFRAQGVIATKKESGIKTVEDLKGKSMVFGPMLGPMGYLQQYDLMLESGIDPEEDLSFYSIPTGSFKHEKVIYSVLHGKYDAGAFPMLDLEKMIDDGRIDPDDFRILAAGEPMPYCTFGATQRVDDSFAGEFKAVLMRLTEEDTVEIDGEVVSVLKRARLDGFADVQDSDYDMIRDMAKRTNMPPYQKY